MNKIAEWRPTKYQSRGGSWRTSLDPNEVGIGSRIMADKVAGFHGSEITRNAKGRLLDLGCGKAPLLGIYSEFVDEAVKVDWGASHGDEFLDLEHDINEPLPFEDASFDTVILSDVLEHLREPALCLEEIFRILTPGGKVIANVPFYYWLHEMPYDYYRFTEFGLKYLFEGSGLEIESLTPLGGAPEVALDLIGKIFMEFRIARPLVKAIFPIYEFVMRSRRFQRYAARTSATMPLGYGVVAQKPESAAKLDA